MPYAKVQVTDYSAAQVGFAFGDYVQVLGRRSGAAAGKESDGFFDVAYESGGAVLFGAERISVPATSTVRTDMTGLWFCMRAPIGEFKRPAPIDRARVGGQISWLLHLAVYVNFGQLVDFLGGIVGLDPAGDDEGPPAPTAPAPEEVKPAANGAAQRNATAGLGSYGMPHASPCRARIERSHPCIPRLIEPRLAR